MTEAELPPDVRDPREMETARGALAAYQAMRLRFHRAFGSVVIAGGLLTDELGRSWLYGELLFGGRADLDLRMLPVGADYESAYGSLQAVRAGAGEVIGRLDKYGPELSPALRGHAYALAAYAEVFLADLFCSGIPLSTVDFEGDYTLRPGSTTADVYRHAVALFDTALTLAADSARIFHLAQVGRGRALLALARYTDASAAVAAVPDGFSYSLLYTLDTGGQDAINEGGFLSRIQGVVTPDLTMADREGINGLDYRSSGDPRTAAVFVRNNKYGYPQWVPAKYKGAGVATVVVADWIEARLIEAEAALQAGDVGLWLAKLNHLRRTAWPTIRPAIDTALADLTDPGTAEARLDLLFRERAFWLYLTGHRQGDLRRLVREYQRPEAEVYPVGPYPGAGGTQYGEDVTIPIPSNEADYNPHFTGCLHRGA